MFFRSSMGSRFVPCREVAAMFAACIVTLGISSPGCGGGEVKEKSLTEQYEEALKQSNPDSRARELVRIALRQHTAGDQGGNQRSLQDAARAADEVKDVNARSSIFILLAGAQATSGYKSDATTSLREARRAVKEMTDAENKAKRHVAIANVYSAQLKNTTAAQDDLRHAQSFAQQIENATGKFETNLLIAAEFAKVNLAAEGDTLIAAAAESANALTDPQARASAYAVLGKTYAQLKRNAEATAALTEAEQAAEKIESPIGRAHTQVEVALALIANQQKKEAGDILEKARQACFKEASQTLQKEALDRVDAAKAML